MVARRRWLAFELDDVFLPLRVTVHLFATGQRRLGARDLHLGVAEALGVDVPDLFVDRAERSAFDPVADTACAAAQRRPNAERVDLRALDEEIGDLPLVEVTAGKDADRSHTGAHELLADVLAILEEVATIEPD